MVSWILRGGWVGVWMDGWTDGWALECRSKKEEMMIMGRDGGVWAVLCFFGEGGGTGGCIKKC